jgi:hypothetical protein
MEPWEGWRSGGVNCFDECRVQTGGREKVLADYYAGDDAKVLDGKRIGVGNKEAAGGHGWAGEDRFQSLETR